jgi:hypothetical protein
MRITTMMATTMSVTINQSGMWTPPFRFEESIRRYLKDFGQIAALHARHSSVAEIRVATGRSARLIAEYIGIYERAKCEFPAAPRFMTSSPPRDRRKGGLVLPPDAR